MQLHAQDTILGSMLGRAALQVFDAVPETPQKFLLLSTYGKGFQVEDDICCISHPKAICDGAVTLPLVLGSFLHTPVCVCLHPTGHTHGYLMEICVSLASFCPVSLLIPICFLEVKACASASHQQL